MLVVVRKQSQHLGARFWQTPEGEVLLVHKNDHGIFGLSVKVGVAIRRINGSRCDSTVEATRLLAEAPLGNDIEIEVFLPHCMANRREREAACQSSATSRPSTLKAEDDDLTCTDVSDTDDSITDMSSSFDDDTSTATITGLDIARIPMNLLAMEIDDNTSCDDLSYTDESVVEESDDVFSAQDNIFFLL